MGLRETFRKIAWSWLALIALGLVMSLGGCIQTVAFLNDVQMYETITAKQLVRKLVIPHMVMLSGLGLLVGSLIFMARHAVIQIRMRHEEL